MLLISGIANAQVSGYDKEIIGKWKGTLSGSGLATKTLFVEFTKSVYNPKTETGTVEGYSTVNNGKKTTFTGTYLIDGDMPFLEIKEPNTSGTNGIFKIGSDCRNDEGDIMENQICGTWNSYDGKIEREVILNKIK